MQPEPAVMPVFRWLMSNPWVSEALAPWAGVKLSIDEQTMVPARVLSSALIECDLPAYPVAVSSEWWNCAATLKASGPAVAEAAAKMGFEAPVPKEGEAPQIVKRERHYAVVFNKQWLIDPLPTPLITGSVSRQGFGGHVSISPIDPDISGETRLSVYRTPTGRVEATWLRTNALADTAFTQSRIWKDRARLRPVINRVLLALRPLAAEIKRELYGLSGRHLIDSPEAAAKV